MTKREYLNILITMPADWIAQSLATPSAYMRPIHLALHRVALRHKKVSA